jgi:phosphatidylserine/phosphatidylglycerophosphate/cardiolipin synthase-like enzyme
MSFDLCSFGLWQTPGQLCPCCRAIYLGKSIASSRAYGLLKDRFEHLRLIYKDHEGIWGLKCLTCQTIYKNESELEQASCIPLHDYEDFQMEYLEKMKISLYAEISSGFPPNFDMNLTISDTPLIDYLFTIICEATQFIHFATWNIDKKLLDALIEASKKVKVRGIIGKPEYSWVTGRIKGLDRQKDSQGYDIDFRIQNGVHSKFIIFDGLMGFDGSANLTEAAWSKANDVDSSRGVIASPREIIRVISKPYEVIELNNTYFSPQWIVYEDDLPFD